MAVWLLQYCTVLGIVSVENAVGWLLGWTQNYSQNISTVFPVSAAASLPHTDKPDKIFSCWPLGKTYFPLIERECCAGDTLCCCQSNILMKDLFSKLSFQVADTPDPDLQPVRSVCAEVWCEYSAASPRCLRRQQRTDYCGRVQGCNNHITCPPFLCQFLIWDFCVTVFFSIVCLIFSPDFHRWCGSSFSTSWEMCWTSLAAPSTSSSPTGWSSTTGRRSSSVTTAPTASRSSTTRAISFGRLAAKVETKYCRQQGNKSWWKFE